MSFAFIHGALVGILFSWLVCYLRSCARERDALDAARALEHSVEVQPHPRPMSKKNSRSFRSVSTE
jgi:hypothetical protein